jgi:tetratricopeptide (TPR) repeat protein
MKTIILITSLLFSFNALTAQDELNKLLYRAYLQNTSSTQAELKQAEIKHRESVKADPKNTGKRYTLALIQWSLLNASMRTQDETLFDDYYDALIDNLDELLDIDNKHAEAYALQSSAYGLKISYSPMQGMFLGPKSSSIIEKAKKINPNSALVWKIYAGSKLFTPEMWGGDVKEAIKAFENSVKLYESKPESLTENWQYLDALAFLGQAYIKDEQPKKAIVIYDKALQVEPEFNYVKKSLLPKAKAIQ